MIESLLYDEVCDACSNNKTKMQISNNCFVEYGNERNSQPMSNTQASLIRLLTSKTSQVS